MSTHTVRVLSYNIHKGFNFGNTRFLLKEIRHSIRLVNADLVFLQEVVGANDRHRQRIHNWAPQQFEFLADEMWPHYAYGKNAIYSHGHHGNAILSRRPFAHYNNLDISHVPTSQRGILSGQIDTGLHLVNLHFGLLEFERKRQMEQLCTLLEQHIPMDTPLILAGDFNDWRRRSHETLLQQPGLSEAFCEKHHQLARTFPARLPLFPMDRIYFRNMDLEDAEILSGDPWRELSDHCALYAEFRYQSTLSSR
jgi:endonuclease/exonuclease/phosphatase family metal-dependent hydrolase